MAYQKTGYQNLLDFDPVTGVIKYGAYEVFANQVGVNKQVKKFNFNSFKHSLLSSNTSPRTNQKPDSALSKQFATDIQNNNLSPNTSNNREDKEDKRENQSPMALLTAIATEYNPFSQVNKIDDDNYEVSSYHIPQDVDFINKLGQAAQGLRITTDKDLLKEQKQTSDARRQGAGTTQLLRDVAAPNVASRTLLP